MAQIVDNKEEIKRKVDYFSFKDGKIYFGFTLTSLELEVKSIRLKYRKIEEKLSFPFHVRRRKVKTGIQYQCWIDTAKESMKEGFWDIVLIIKKQGEVKEVFLGGQEAFRKIAMTILPCWCKVRDDAVIYAFINDRRHFSIQYRSFLPEYDSWKFFAKEYLAILCYVLLKPYWDSRKIWLICEKFSSMAQDNGYFFFKYCMEKLPEKERKRIFYIIDPKANTEGRLEPYHEQVLPFMSFRHMVYLHAAELLISSDAIRHFYAWDSLNTVSKISYQMRKNIVFLQHGVMAFKKCHDTFKKSGGNRMALFVVSSKREQEIIQDYFGYDKEEIIITGLPRWDNLRDTSRADHKEILIMPTWRNWLDNVEEEEFLASEYYGSYKSLLTSEELKNYLEEKDIYVNFYIHPKFRDYMHLFIKDSDRIKLIPFGAEPLNELLMSCKMMITDYSSASWDVYYQGKPVLFYVFDKKKYDELQGSYIDMEKEGFGDLIYSEEELMLQIKAYVENDFQEKEQYAERRVRLLPYQDHDNSERVYQKIKTTKLKNKLFQKILKGIK